MRWVFFCSRIYTTRWISHGSHRHFNSLPEFKLYQVDAPSKKPKSENRNPRAGIFSHSLSFTGLLKFTHYIRCELETQDLQKA